MITTFLQNAGTVSQTASTGGSSIPTDIVLLLGVAALIVVVLAWMSTRGSSE